MMKYERNFFMKEGNRNVGICLLGAGFVFCGDGDHAMCDGCAGVALPPQDSLGAKSRPADHPFGEEPRVEYLLKTLSLLSERVRVGRLETTLEICDGGLSKETRRGILDYCEKNPWVVFTEE